MIINYVKIRLQPLNDEYCRQDFTQKKSLD